MIPIDPKGHKLQELLQHSIERILNTLPGQCIKPVKKHLIQVPNLAYYLIHRVIINVDEFKTFLVETRVTGVDQECQGSGSDVVIEQNYCVLD